MIDRQHVDGRFRDSSFKPTPCSAAYSELSDAVSKRRKASGGSCTPAVTAERIIIARQSSRVEVQREVVTDSLGLSYPQRAGP